MTLKRGMLIVLEGNDCTGKTTQAMKLLEWLKGQGNASELIRFPDRSTPIGQMINQYLIGKTKLHNNAIHLLFSANRWEKYDEMLSALKSGKILVVDRYSYSGVAYTAAKGVDESWCREPEKGLLKPDCVIFLASDINMIENRKDFGQEVYETSEFQASVRNIYLKMKEDDWNIVNANQSIDKVHQDIVNIVNGKLATLPDEISKMW